MSFISKLGLGLGGLIAYAGRGIIAAHYGRAVQGATDPYIKYVGGGFLAIVAAIIVNFACVMLKLYSVQTVLAVALPFVAFYFLLAPKVAIPAIAVAAANTAATPGDQPNVWLVRDGAKTLASFMAIGLFWIEAYIFTTMLAPFDLYPVFFMVLHIPLIMVLLTLMTGRVKVSPELYNRAFWVSTTLVLAGVLVVFVFGAQLGPKWAEISASRASRAVASNATQSIRKADQARADWEERYVRIGDTGFQVVCIDKQNKLVPKHIKCDEGTMTVDDAAPYQAAQDALKQEAIRRVTGKSGAKEGKDGAAQSGKSDCRYWEPCYWVGVAHKWSEEWGVPLFVAGFVVILMVLVHFIPLIWGGKVLFGKKEEEVATDSKKKKEEKKDDTEKSRPLLAIVLMIGAVWIFYIWATMTPDGYAITKRIVSTDVTHADLRQDATVKYVRAWFTNPNHAFYDKPLDVQAGIHFGQRLTGWNRIARPDENPIVIVANDINVYVLRQDSYDRATDTTVGRWVNYFAQEHSGNYMISRNENTGVLTARLAGDGPVEEVQFKKFHQ